MKDNLFVEVNKVRGIKHLEMCMPLKPDIYAITGINGIGKSTLLSCITPRLKRPVSFSSLAEDASEDSSIKYRIGEDEEIWKVDRGVMVKRFCNTTV